MNSDPDDAPVSVLFSDIEASTEYYAKLGDRAARELFDAHDVAVATAIADHGGRIVKLLGDGVLATFASPRRAVHGAVAIQRAVSERFDGLRVRVAVHAGEVVERADDVHGNAVNVAARLVAKAQPGSIIVSDVVRQLLGPSHDLVFRDHGRVPLKGLPGKWRLHEVVWDDSVPRPPRADAAAPVVTLPGRAPVLARLEGALTAALAGSPQLALITGEAGIGKTTTARLIVDTAVERGARVRWGTAWDGEGSPPFWPWAQVLEHPLDELRPVPEPRDADQARFLLFDAVASSLARLAERESLVVVFDDLHWADESSLHLLAFVARHVRRGRLLILGTYRDEDAAADLRVGPLIAHLTRAGQVVSLPALDRDDVALLLGDLAGRRPPDDVVDKVVDRTAGNPFFVREVGRLFAAHGETTGVPEGVRELVERRLARLPARCVEILTAAAVIGQDVALDVLAAVTGQSLVDLFDPLDDAVRARVLADPASPLGPYRFAHDLFRETVYGRIGKRELAALHLAVADALGAVTSRPVHPAELARHLTSALPLAPLERVVEAERAAADRAARELAYDEAVKHCDRALRALDLDGGAAGEQRIELLLDRGAAETRAGRSDQAAATYHEAIRSAREHGLDEQFGAAVLGLQTLGSLTGREDREREDLLEEALGRVGSHDSDRRARLLAELARGRLHTVSRPATDLEPVAREAVAIARRLGDPATLAATLNALHDVAWLPGRGRERLEVVTEMLAAARDAADWELTFRGHELRLASMLEIGDAGAAAELEIMARLAEELHQPRLDWYVTTRRACLAIMAGDLEAADRLVEEGLRLGAEIGEPDTLLVHGCALIELAAARGALADVGSALDALPRQSVQAGQLIWRAQVDVARGDHRRGRAAVEAAFAEDFLVRTGLSATLVGLTWLARVVVALEDAGAARRVYDTYLPFAQSNVVGGGAVVFGGAIAHHLGLLAALFGDPEAAREHLEGAVAMHERMGADVWTAQSQIALGRLLGASDPARARQLLETARVAADRIGMPSFAAEADSTLARLPLPSERPELVLRGDLWEVAWAGTTAHAPQCKGLQDLAVLVARAGEEVHVAELVAVDEAGAADAILDERAKAEYRRRLADLERDLADAEAGADLARIDALRDERDAIVNELRSAVGMGGRDRRLGDPGERARKAVRARIRDAINRVEVVHPSLAEHLRATVATGTYCSYRPDAPR